MSDSLEPLYFGNYEVLQRPGGGHWLLGEGGYGRTYKAVHRFLQRECALKIIHERHMRNERQRARFLHEAQTAARLSHRGIAHVYDFGEHDGVFFYAMEFCQGGNLDELSKRRGPMPWPEVADFARQIGDALACAHGAGLLHRDLKPQNVMLASQNRPHIAKLIDFGLVKILPTVENDSTWAIQSVEGGFKGNYATASPEQTGEEEDLDERSDLFSFGVILWWMLIGHNPFEGMSNPRLIADRLSPESYEPRLPQELDDASRAVMARLLEKRPENRFSTARDLLAALGGLQGAARPAPGPPLESDETTEMSPADLPPETPPVPDRPSFEDSFEVVSTLEDLQAAKLYGCRDGAGNPFSALIPEPDAAEGALEGLRRAGNDGARFPCLDYHGTWLAEGGKPVFVFGPVGPLRLLEVLKILGSARLLELAPMLGRLARSIDRSTREFGLGLELNPHTLRVATSGGGAELGSWSDIDPLSLRTIPSLPGSGEDSQDVSDASTIVTEESMFPMVSQFSALIYRLVSGTAVKHSAYFSSAAYVPAAALSEDGNQLLRSLISGEAGEPGVLAVIRDLAPLEGLSVDLFGLNEEEPVAESLPVPVPVIAARAELEKAARIETERKAREEAERKAREEAERKAREEAEARAKLEAEAKAKEEAERRAREEAERKAREEAERKAREEAEARAKLEAEARAKEEAERRAREEAERKAREEAERKAREEAEARAKSEADAKAKKEAERQAKEEAKRRAAESEAQTKAREETERKAKEEAERKAKEEAERKVRQEEAERKASEEAERKAKEAAERKAHEEERRKAKEEAKRKAREEAERKKQEAVERKARDKAERAAKAAATRQAKHQQKDSTQAVEEKPPEKEAEPPRFPKIIQTAEAGDAAGVPADDPIAKRGELRKRKPASAAVAGEKRGKPLGLMVGGGIAAVLAIGIGAFFAFKGKTSNGGDNGGGGGGGGTSLVKFTQLENLRLAPGLESTDLDIRAKSADSGELVSARWQDGDQRAFFDGRIEGLVTVTLRDGLVFEERWSEGSSIANQVEGSPGDLELGQVRQVFGVELPGVLRDPSGQVEPVRKDWLTLERDGKELPFQLVEAEDPARRRALWLGLIPNRAPESSEFSPRGPASVAAAPMPEGMELVLLVPGYRKLTRSPGEPLPDPIKLRAAEVSLMVRIPSASAAGSPYQSVVLRPENAGAEAAPAIPVEALRQGRQVPLRGGPYQVEFRGRGKSGEDDLLATAMMVIPPDCADEGKLLLPAALPGLEVRIEGERIDFRTLRFKPSDDAGRPPPDLQLGASGLEVKWRDLEVKADQATESLDLAALRESEQRTARVLLPGTTCEFEALDSLLPAGLLPRIDKRDLSSPDAASEPLVISAKFSGVYRASSERGLDLVPLPGDFEEATDIGFEMENQPVVKWWHNLRLSLSLPTFGKAIKSAFGQDFPTSTVYIETDLDLSGSRPQLFFYCLNQVNGWSANWGTLELGAFEPDGTGFCGVEKVIFKPKWGRFYLTDDKAKKLRFDFGSPGGRGLDYTAAVRKSASDQVFRPWWPLYPDWRRESPGLAPDSGEGAEMDIGLRSRGGAIHLEVAKLRELFLPADDIWKNDQLNLRPEDRREEIAAELRDKHKGLLKVVLFDEARELTPATALTPDLWGFLETE